jgi:hypothetical protein
VSLVALSATLAACNNQTPPPVTPASMAPASAAPAASPSPSPVLDGVDFVDDFSGTGVDDTKWLAWQQTGLFLMKDGHLEMLNAGNQPDFPLLISKNVIIPQDGPYFFETNFQFLANGSPVSFNLDWEPPEQPGVDGLTVPFMRTQPVASSLRMIFNTEDGTKNVDTGLGTLDPKTGAHTLRIEFDGKDGYRVLFDGEEKGTFTSKRRPRKFWVGAYPNKGVPSTAWPRISFDYVKAGVFTPTPAPSATPTP